jgi:D-serine deaminase-like pyridoxal phosphate-dependent protein
VILDSGSKTLTNDGARGFAPAPGHGTVLRSASGTAPGSPGRTSRTGDLDIDSDLLIERLSEEHATVRVLSKVTDLEPGDRVRIVPNHSCVVSNLVDAVWLVEGDRVIERLPVAARGRIT